MSDLSKFQTFALAQFDANTRTVSGLAVPYLRPTRAEHRVQIVFAKDAISFGPRVELSVYHDPKQIVAASPDTMKLSASEDGIYAEARLLDTQRGIDTAKELEAGVLKGFSVEVDIHKNSVTKRSGVFHVGAADMDRVSLVPTPAFSGTEAALLSLYEELPDLDAKPRKPERIVRYF